MTESVKICKHCCIEKSIDDFYLTSDKKRRRTICKKCVILLHATKMRERRSFVPDLEGEEWRWVVGFENYYQASNLGRIKGVERWITNSNGFSTLKREYVLKGYLNDDGYLKYTLSKDGECFSVIGNQIIAKAFLVNPRPDIYFQTNHKNGVRHDNRVVNIEWCDADYNNNYKYDILGFKFPKGEENALSKEIVVTYPDGREENIKGILEASRRLNLLRKGIYKVLKKESQEYKGYKFKYA
jgi:NUMOD4 motif